MNSATAIYAIYWYCTCVIVYMMVYCTDWFVDLNPRWPLSAILDLWPVKFVVKITSMPLNCLVWKYYKYICDIFAVHSNQLVEIKDGRRTPSWNWGRTCVWAEFVRYWPKVHLCQRRHLYYDLKSQVAYAVNYLCDCYCQRPSHQ